MSVSKNKTKSNKDSLSTTCREDDEVLLEQRVFMLDDKAFVEFERALEEPRHNADELEKLLQEKSPSEKEKPDLTNVHPVYK